MKSKTYMERVAKTLNVEIGEKFDIVYTKSKKLYGRSFQITEEGIIDNNSILCDGTMVFLLTRKLSVQKQKEQMTEKERVELAQKYYGFINIVNKK